ncbi:hypothetical protein E2K80_07505 [Rhodophyticola sp. CCM32]|uniref:hypothetical protein n=1 Tax=Rhodophyticola sp. CCM32 TaxID=2916397 RepID=UPI00107FCFB7|nr:hypothetical protein [Rhodophyticola sp. CCM32]QBY00605.1 hypothetical protein E2K80_07505 [Rhodophyticola sp. CCM32]
MDLGYLKKCDVVWFEGRTGFAIDLKKGVFVALTNPPRGLGQRDNWENIVFDLNDMREVISKVGVPTEFFTSGTQAGVLGGARQAGEAAGVGIKNAMERSKAKRNNGLEFAIRSTQTPSFFAQVVDDSKRAQLFEAVRQIFETGTVDRRIVRIPDAVSSSFYKPSKAEIEQKEAQSQARQSAVQKYLLIGSFAVVAIVAAFGLWAWLSSTAYRNAALAGEDMSEAGAIRCAMLTFGHSLKPSRARSIVITSFIAESDDPDVGLYPSHNFERGTFVDGPREEDGRLWYGVTSDWAFIDIENNELSNFRRAEVPSCS